MNVDFNEICPKKTFMVIRVGKTKLLKNINFVFKFLSWGTCCRHRCVSSFRWKISKNTRTTDFFDRHEFHWTQNVYDRGNSDWAYPFILFTICCSGSQWVDLLFTTIFVNSFNSCDTHTNVQLADYLFVSLNEQIETIRYASQGERSIRWAFVHFIHIRSVMHVANANVNAKVLRRFAYKSECTVNNWLNGPMNEFQFQLLIVQPILI